MKRIGGSEREGRDTDPFQTLSLISREFNPQNTDATPCKMEVMSKVSGALWNVAHFSMLEFETLFLYVKLRNSEWPKVIQ